MAWDNTGGGSGSKGILKAGELDTPIDVYYNTSTQNDYGEITKSKTLLKTIWAKLIITGTKGNEKVEDDTIRAESKINFLVRYDDDLQMNSSTISPEDYFEILYESKYWNVMSMETLGRGKGIIIRCNLTDNNLG
jgi:head-tail adaptor